MRFVFSKQAEVWLQNADAKISRRIAKKLLEYLDTDDPLKFTKPLTTGHLPRYYRFRIGEYRVIFLIEKKELMIVKIGHRKDIYKVSP